MLVLDVQCGWGRYSIPPTRKGERNIGIDALRNMPKEYRAYSGDLYLITADLACTSTTHMQFIDGSFRGGSCMSTIYYIDGKHRARVMGESKRLCAGTKVQHRNIIFHILVKVLKLRSRKFRFPSELTTRPLFTETVSSQQDSRQARCLLWAGKEDRVSCSPDQRSAGSKYWSDERLLL